MASCFQGEVGRGWISGGEGGRRGDRREREKGRNKGREREEREVEIT